jgi:hypothetical protein
MILQKKDIKKQKIKRYERYPKKTQDQTQIYKILILGSQKVQKQFYQTCKKSSLF